MYTDNQGIEGRPSIGLPSPRHTYLVSRYSSNPHLDPCTLKKKGKRKKISNPRIARK